jgi:hypothetical protein
VNGVLDVVHHEKREVVVTVQRGHQARQVHLAASKFGANVLEVFVDLIEVSFHLQGLALLDNNLS